MAITTISAFTRAFNALWANRNALRGLIFRPAATDETRRRGPVGKAISRLVFHVFSSRAAMRRIRQPRAKLSICSFAPLTKLKCCCLTVDTTLQKAVSKGAVRVEQTQFAIIILGLIILGS
jgi:hypothetical protein